MRFLLFFLLLLTSCSHSSRSSSEATRYVTALCQELKEVESESELKERELRIKKLFNSLAQLLIQSSRSPDSGSVRPISPELAKQLREQMERIYRMDGGKEIMERAQEEALRSLDRSLPRD